VVKTESHSTNVLLFSPERQIDSMVSSALLTCRLYKSLLKAVRPFCEPSNKGKVLTCLLHRTGFEDESWASFLRDASDDDDADDFAMDDDETTSPQRILFRSLLREVVAGDSIRQMNWPSFVDPTVLKSLIRREFRYSENSKSSQYSSKVGQSVAFIALAALNKKLAWYENLQKDAPIVRPEQAAAFVSPLPMKPPKSFLRPGAFLIAHPHLTGYFRRTVICILDSKDEEDIKMTGSYGTYGLIVNRIRTSPQTNKNMTLEEVLRPVPDDLSLAFGGCVVKEGGPVHMSLQMLYSSTPDLEELRIGGNPISLLPDGDVQDSQSAAQHSDRAVYSRGDVLAAANAVLSGSLDRDDVTFFVGASAWQPGQLEGEVERGCWLPCRGPPEIALSGTCAHIPATKDDPRPLTDLWLSMLSSCGEAEAEFAHLMSVDNGDCDLGRACDDDY
jgi:putative AlgH/UPF0301 family transcriptional regulator